MKIIWTLYNFSKESPIYLYKTMYFSVPHIAYFSGILQRGPHFATEQFF